jgi:hypothetical protein
MARIVTAKPPRPRHPARKRKFVLTAAAVIASAGRPAMADTNSYACTVTMASGLHFNRETKQWQPQQFAAGSQYILRKLTDEDAKGDLGASVYRETDRLGPAIVSGH